MGAFCDDYESSRCPCILAFVFHNNYWWRQMGNSHAFSSCANTGIVEAVLCKCGVFYKSLNNIHRNCKNTINFEYSHLQLLFCFVFLLYDENGINNHRSSSMYGLLITITIPESVSQLKGNHPMLPCVRPVSKHMWHKNEIQFEPKTASTALIFFYIYHDH